MVSTSALLLGVPWALAFSDEQQVQEMEREMRMQQSANEVSQNTEDEEMKGISANKIMNSFLLLALDRDRAMRDRRCKHKRTKSRRSVQFCGISSRVREDTCSACIIFSALRRPFDGVGCGHHVFSRILAPVCGCLKKYRKYVDMPLKRYASPTASANSIE